MQYGHDRRPLAIDWEPPIEASAPLPERDVWERAMRRHVEADIQYALALVAKIAGPDYLPPERAAGIFRKWDA